MPKSATARRPTTAGKVTTRKTKPRVPLLRLLREADADANALAAKTAPAFAFIDLFAGIGGMRLGFESNGGKCIFTCERDPYCQKTYAANFPDDEHEIAGDIRDVSPADVPDHDVLLAGFPCQPFSTISVSQKNAQSRIQKFLCHGAS